MRRDYLKSKGYKIVEIWECKWWESVKEEENVGNHVKELSFQITFEARVFISYNKRWGDVWIGTM